MQEELRGNGLSDMQFFLLKHGESRLIEIKEADEKQGEEENQDNAEGENKENQDTAEGERVEQYQDEEPDQGLIDYLVDKMAGEEEPKDE